MAPAAAKPYHPGRMLSRWILYELCPSALRLSYTANWMAGFSTRKIWGTTPWDSPPPPNAPHESTGCLRNSACSKMPKGNTDMAKIPCYDGVKFKPQQQWNNYFHWARKRICAKWAATQNSEIFCSQLEANNSDVAYPRRNFRHIKGVKQRCEVRVFYTYIYIAPLVYVSRSPLAE